MSHRDAFHSEHEEVWELLPWHVNGTLEGRDARRVERHLGHCLPCHAELGRQRELASLVQAPEALPLSPSHGLARLEGRLDRSRRPTTRRALGWGWLALAEAAIIVVLLSAVFAQRRPPTLPQATFETLGDVPPALDRASGPVYRALFAESASERELRELLAGLDLRIVDGPSPVGLFTLELTAGTRDPRAPAAVLANLRAHDAVRFAERIDRPSAPQSD